MSVLVTSPTSAAPTSPPLPAGVQVRRLTARDLPLLNAFQKAHNLSLSSTSLSSPQTLCLLTTTSELPPTGCLIVTLSCTPPTPTLHITTLFVAPSNRRQGLASVLLDHARKWAENAVGRCHRRLSNAVNVVVGEDASSDQGGSAFWDKMGLKDGQGLIELA